MTNLAIASSSQLAADAGLEISEAGGNAVDAAIAASLVQLTTEPGVVSLGGGAIIVIWPPNGHPVMIDCTSEMPGRNAPAERLARAGIDVILAYGGGTPTTVGYPSVATPGALAGYDLTAQQYGRIPWKVLVEPAYQLAKNGFPLLNVTSSKLTPAYSVGILTPCIRYRMKTDRLSVPERKYLSTD